ncbi:hypothetical protein GGX14DRAFT_563915 [Mycena pura]|uniref:Uncharacterized protein n=1 Tax=Mycena pura TaxID=153505 RepID=A0AAD6VLY4_9AGAR|nr:hypothetical protein GGX14DRAFT_563915 [Mycena pura]
MFRTSLFPLKQSNRPHIATLTAQNLGQLDKDAFQDLLEEGISNSSNLYEVLDVETQPSVSVIGCPPNVVVSFRSKHEGTTEGMLNRISILEDEVRTLREEVRTLREEVRTLREEVRTVQKDVGTLQEEARTANSVSVNWQVWSRAQDAVDEFIFEAERAKCMRRGQTLGFSSAQELRNAIDLPTAANHAAAQRVVTSASSQLREAAVAIRVAKRQLEVARMALAHPVVTVADLRRVVADDIPTAILAQIESSSRAGIRRFV